MKVCPYYNRVNSNGTRQCNITDNTTSELFCPKHLDPLVDYIAPESTAEEPELTVSVEVNEIALQEVSETISIDMSSIKDASNFNPEGLSCTRNHSFDSRRDYENQKCWCGAGFPLYQENNTTENVFEQNMPAKNTLQQNIKTDSIAKEPVAPTRFEQPKIEFVITYKGQDFNSSDKIIEIGREKCFCEDLRKLLLVDAVGISRQHLKIEKLGDAEAIFTDLNSANGTFFGGIKINSNGSRIALPADVELGNPNTHGIIIEVKNG